MKSSHNNTPNHSPLKFNRLNIFRVATALVIILSLFEVALLSTTSQTDPPLKSTEKTTVKWDGNLPALPENKTQAKDFEKKIGSGLNFDLVNNLNQAYRNGADATSLITKVAPNTTPSVSNGSIVPPLPTIGNKLVQAQAACTGTLNDPFDPAPAYHGDDNVSNPYDRTFAVNLDVAVVQNRALFPSNDVDWGKFVVSSGNAGRTFTITTSIPDLAANVITTIQVFKSANASNIPDYSASGNSTDGSAVVVISNAEATTYFVRVLPGLVPPDCGQYDLRLDVSTSTIAPTGTVTTNVCTDAYESDNNPQIAKLLKVSQATSANFAPTPGLPTIDANNNASQNHFACPTGDVDWVYFDLVKGKPYSVFTSNLTNGLDSFMVLYTMNADGSLNPIYSSDDYPGAGLASRIDWIVPSTVNTPLGEFARYYLAVKDVAGHGANSMSYTLTLAALGNGLGECYDLYEPDNGPIEAKEIVVNEVQNHVFCPQGDADWVKFFAKAGRVYNVYTNFSGLNTVGLDTNLFIWAITFDPNDPTKIASQILLGQNDDRSDADLSSTINFRVPADGVYYAEIRNAGGVGRNGLYYRMGFVTGNGPTPTLAPSSTTATATATPTPTETATSNSLVAALGLSISDPSFLKVWNYADLPVLMGRTSRSWVWGPPGAVKNETYAEALNGNRQVQYFDKSRMEINLPKGDRSSPWFVTNGLLAKEMVTGRVATGDTANSSQSPAQLPVAGDFSDNPSPTYASFAGLITNGDVNRATEQGGKLVTAALRADGTLSNLDKVAAEVKLSRYIKETGHNIPDVFWNYLNLSGLVYDGGTYSQNALINWVYVVGLPLSEPVWVKAKVGGVEKDVMVQVFERRVLTYTPSNVAQWQVEMGNVGQHYYLWRYGQSMPHP